MVQRKGFITLALKTRSPVVGQKQSENKGFTLVVVCNDNFPTNNSDLA